MPCLYNAKYKEFIKSLPVDKQSLCVERSLRVLPQEIMDEVAPVQLNLQVFQSY